MYVKVKYLGSKTALPHWPNLA